MKTRHQKILVMAGLICLLLIPIVLYVLMHQHSDTQSRIGVIMVEIPIGDGPAPPMDSMYSLPWKDGQLEAMQFEHFLQSRKVQTSTGRPNWGKIYRIDLPDGCHYKEFIQCIDILQRNGYLCGSQGRTLTFVFAPRIRTESVTIRLSAQQEWMYAYQRMKTEIDTLLNKIKRYPRNLIDGNADLGPPTERIMRYSDAPSSPLWLPDFIYYAEYVTQEEPTSKILFDTMGLWLLPMVAVWMMLLYIEVQKVRRHYLSI